MPIKIGLSLDTKAASRAFDQFKAQAEKAGINVKVDDKAIAGLNKMQAGVQVFNTALNVTKGIVDTFPDTFGETGKTISEVVPHLTNAASQTASWAIQGAAIGSVIPGIGTGVGAIVGGLGGAASATLDWYNNTKDVQRTLKEIEEQEIVKAWTDLAATMEKGHKLFAQQNKDYSDDMAAAFKASIKESAALNEELDKTPPKAHKAKESFTDWLDATYSKATTARDALRSLNDEVISSLEKDSVSARVSRMRDVTGTAGAHGFDHQPGDNQAPVPAPSDEAFKEAQARYASYANTVMSITGELTSQLEKNIAQGNNAFAGMGRAALGGVSEVLKALAKLWGIKAIGEFADGLHALANPAEAALRGESAPTHFLAAAKYGAAAVAAGVGGAVLGGLSQRDAGGAGAGGGASSGNSAGGGSPYSSGGSMGGSHFDPGPKTLGNATYIFNGPILADGEDAKAKIGRWIKDAQEAADNAGPWTRGGR